MENINNYQQEGQSDQNSDCSGDNHSQERKDSSYQNEPEMQDKIIRVQTNEGGKIANNDKDLKHVSSQQLSQHQYSAHYTGTAPSDTTAKKPSEMSALDRLKSIQNNFKRQWNGIDCAQCGRTGTSNFVNKKRTFNISEQYYEEEERQKSLAKIFLKLKDIEDDKLMLGTNTQFNKTTVNSSQASGGFFQSSNPSTTTSSSQKKENECITFKNIKENQLVSHSQPFSGYQKSYHIENQELLFKLLRFENKLLRSILETNGFTQTESHEWNILWSAWTPKSYIYEGLNEYQKVNHFPQSYEITRKDSLCYNMVRMQEKFGKQNFDFVPDTYILPDEFGDFYAHYQKLKQHDSKKNIWIVKPANSSQGKGIYIVDDINDVNVDETSVISRYVTNPLLINGHKFDLRIYVLVASYEPMRLYCFQEGLARFASETYTSKINKNNKFMHLTNYSINKKNDNFVQNENAEQDDFGFKWSLGAFCKHLEQVGIDMNLLWSRIYDVIIKTIISGEHLVTAAMKKNGTHRTNCFEIFGFDVLIDSDLKPWLLEVNASPSLATDSPLDLTIKSNLLTDAFNLVGIKRFDRKKESLNKIKHRMKGYYQGSGSKKTGFGAGIQGTSLQPSASGLNNEIYHQPTSAQLYQLIDKYVAENPQEFGNMHENLRKAVSFRYKDYIRETLLEYPKKSNFVRIYPSKNTDIYDAFFSGPKPYNKVVYKALYTDEILRCIQPKPTNDAKLNYKIDIPPNSYEQYKNKQQERVQQNYVREESKQSSQLEQMNETTNSVQSQSIKNTTKQQLMPQIKERPTTGILPKTADMSRISQTQQQNSFNTSVTQATKSQDNSQVQSQQNIQQPATSQAETKQNQEKVLITGDDILIEYADRLMNAIKGIPDDLISDQQKIALDKFITHYVWHSQERRMEDEVPYTPYWYRLEGRLNEMQERRRRLIKYLYKKEGKLNEFEDGFRSSISKKTTIIKKFSSIQLEDLLRTSTKNVAQEVVSSLIPQNGGFGVLADIERIFQGGDNRRRTASLRKNRPENEDPGYEATNDIDSSNRSGNNLRQSKSANAARSLTRKNQQQLNNQDEIFPLHSVAKQQTGGLTSTTSNNSATRMLVGKGTVMQSRSGYGDQQNLTELIQKREISSNYIKRILDGQPGGIKS